MASGIVKSMAETLSSSDAQKMQTIFYNQFQLLAQDYLLTSEEIKAINIEFMRMNMGDIFKLMYHDIDHYRFATLVILEKIAEQYSKREALKVVL